jgi:hypothetical protein
MKSKNNDLKGLLCLFVFALINNVSLFAKNGETITYTDSTTGSHIVFPSALNIKPARQIDFNRAVIEYKKSNVILYFMISPEKNQVYSWEKINEFDNNAQYGDFVLSEPLTTVEGYIRTYKLKNYYNQIAIIRGGYYVCYLVEACYNKDDFHLKEIVENSNFNIKPGKKADWNTPVLITYAVTLLLIVLLGIVLKIRKYDGWFWIVVILGVPIAYWFYTCLAANYAMLFSFYHALTFFFVALGIWICNSWKDVKKIFANI